MIRKLIISTVLSFVILCSCNSNSGSANVQRIQKPELISSLPEGKIFIDGQLELLFNEYKILCESKRNDQLKDKYLELQSKLLILNELGFNLPGLNSSEQNDLVQYTSDKIKANQELHDLAYSGEIKCW